MPDVYRVLPAFGRFIPLDASFTARLEAFHDSGHPRPANGKSVGQECPTHTIPYAYWLHFLYGHCA